MTKFIIYQVLPRLFGNYFTVNKKNGSIDENGCGKFNAFTSKALKEIKSLGITHVWYTGVIEHATQTDYSQFGIKKDHSAIVKGIAGSPYAIKDYYDVDPDLAVDVNNRMLEFESLVNRTHKAGLKVIIDFIPNHVAREYYSDVKPKDIIDLGEKDKIDCAFRKNNNFYYLPDRKFQPTFDIGDYFEYPAKVTGNDQFTDTPGINDWYETIKLNYGVDYLDNHNKHFDETPDTWNKMLDILSFWSKKGIDGFRCDMAEMVPVEFWHWAIKKVKDAFPDVIFIAEVYNPDQYRNYILTGGFDYLYDKVGMYDLLKNITCNDYSCSLITQAWQSLSGIQENMLHFLENHDEQRIASDFFTKDAWKIIPALIVSATLTNAPFMIYAGQELGEQGMDEEGFSGLDGRTTIFDYWGVKSIQNWTNKGKFDGKNLTAEQKALRVFYQKLLNICLEQKAISRGVMYDLQYANYQNLSFNPNKQYSFIRKFENETLLVIVNFDDITVDVEVRIPSEAFEYLELKEDFDYELSDLLDENYSDKQIINSHEPVKISLNRNSGRILVLRPI
jgi:glycosidase